MSQQLYVHDILPFIGEFAAETRNLESAVHDPLSDADLPKLVTGLDTQLQLAGRYMDILPAGSALAEQLRSAMSKAQSELANARAEID